MEMRFAAGAAFVFLLSFASIAGVASANLVVEPARLGILRLYLFPMSPAVAVRELRVGNTYNTSMQVELSAVDNMTSLVSFSEENFTLAPNESKTVEYTVSVDEPGYYLGSVMIKATVPDRGSLGYNADLAVYVYKGNLQPYFYAGAAIVVIAVAAVAIFFFRKSTGRGSKR